MRPKYATIRPSAPPEARWEKKPAESCAEQYGETVTSPTPLLRAALARIPRRARDRARRSGRDYCGPLMTVTTTWWVAIFPAWSLACARMVWAELSGNPTVFQLA